MPEEIHDAERAALEGALRALQPLPPRLDRDQLLFRAGQESVRQSRWIWPSVAAASLLLTVGLSGYLAVRPPRERVVLVQVENPSSPEAPSPSRPVRQTGELLAYLHLREQIVEHGVETLRPSPPVPVPEQSLTIRVLSDQ